jgi:EmrB/QacA subfamily drug resistance transporter
MVEAPARLSPRQIITAMSGLVVAMLLAQLDNMIVAPALPTIVGDLGGLQHLSWVVTGYILASTVATPIWGKLGDLFGHKLSFMASIVLFLLGSALCGLSQNMAELVGFRALQGLGAGGLMVGIMSVIGMLVTPRERGKYMGIMMAVMPAAMIGGPLLGGWITDHVSWRWIFYVNLPLGIVSLFVVWSTLHLAREERHTTVVIDWWGAATLTAWTSALVLMITWGGNQYPWGSWQELGLGAVALVMFLVFLRTQRRAVDPILPLRLFRNVNFSLANTLGFVAGFAMFGGITFLPQYQQFVQGQSATNSGLLLLPMMLSAMFFSLAVGQLISRTGVYRPFPIIGTALLALGMWLFSTMGVTTGTGTTAAFMVALGAGMGCLMQTTNLIAQNSVSLRDMGAATGGTTFVRTLGGSLGVAILGAVYTNRLVSTVTSAGAPAGASPRTGTLTPESLRKLPEAFQALFQHAVVNGTHAIFLIAAVVGLVGFAASFGIRHVPLRDNEPAPAAEVGQDDPATTAEELDVVAPV